MAVAWSTGIPKITVKNSIGGMSVSTPAWTYLLTASITLAATIALSSSDGEARSSHSTKNSSTSGRMPKAIKREMKGRMINGPTYLCCRWATRVFHVCLSWADANCAASDPTKILHGMESVMAMALICVFTWASGLATWGANDLADTPDKARYL